MYLLLSHESCVWGVSFFNAQQMYPKPMNAAFSRPHNNPYAQTNNPGWRNHPNFSWSQNNNDHSWSNHASHFHHSNNSSNHQPNFSNFHHNSPNHPPNFSNYQQNFPNQSSQLSFQNPQLERRMTDFERNMKRYMKNSHMDKIIEIFNQVKINVLPWCHPTSHILCKIS